MIKSSEENPFSCSIYESTWLKHFYNNQSSLNVNAIEGVQFIKHKYFPFLVNVGTNTTNGLVYSLNIKASDFKGGVYLIYDVPNYYKVKNENESRNLKIKKIRQYSGFATSLKDVQNSDEFINSKFSSGSRKRFRRSFRRLESCTKITYKTYYGEVSKDEYNILLEQFKSLIKKRYDELKMEVTLISRWPFFEDLLYPMIQNKKAAIFGIYSNGTPISLSMVFLNNDTLFNAVKAFDADYYKFNIGHLDISRILEWCLENNITTIDFSKGEYEYKTRWTNMKYYYECNIIYDSKSFVASSTALLLSKYFWLKQYLRDKNINLLYTKFKYGIKNLLDFKKEKSKFIIEDLNNFKLNGLQKEIDLIDPEFSFLKRITLDTLYSNPEPLSSIKAYISNNQNSEIYYVIGNKNKFTVRFR
ncbi:GNAT family N-acetyltransferase [Xanthomarina spongicola]|uniref:Acetyltransferase (GNAT) family protein n=1 Tax=Xanthomarina spongicola TaxID=570520 RepID=A0A316DR63_9FLAO|nr:GNAT family N-acetyltransferase [Xanthomarina spongicola]PWK19968.1 acetyltransferase (GNAT) family protein [Xanthomarina spongicola]